jgi:hypothetical protein
LTTPSSEIIDLFLTRVNDYRLTTKYQTSGSLAFGTYIEPWLLDAISDFEDTCDQDLTYTTSGSATEGYFTEDLTRINKVFLSRIMVKYWLAKEIQDIIQMNLFVQDHDFKTHSPSQNLKAKQDYYNVKVEEISQMLIDYAYQRNIDWDNWKIQLFDA